MMVNKRRVIVIENQFIQFKEIIKLLDEAGHESYPDQETFQTYLDAVKIYLNPRYSKERREKYLEKVMEMTTHFNPELVIIDHILVGTDSAQDGIDLALTFRDKGIMQPIIFFSRTELNNIDVCDKLPKVTLVKDWVFKGYSGAEILEPEYFRKMVIPKIETLLKKSLQIRMLQRLTEKKPKKTAIEYATIDKIISKTVVLMKAISDNAINISEELLAKLTDELSDAMYLKILNEEFPANEVVS